MIWHTHDGRSVAWITAALRGLSASTIRRIRKHFQCTGGVPLPSKHKGPKQKLNRSQVRVLKMLIDEKPDLYNDELARWLSFRTGITVDPSTVGRYLHRMRYSRKKVFAAMQSRACLTSACMEDVADGC